MIRVLCCVPVVFGKVVEGMDVVKAVEGVGSGSGATRAKVMIAASVRVVVRFSCGMFSLFRLGVPSHTASI